MALSAFDVMKATTERIQQEANRAIASINNDLKEVTQEYDALRSVGPPAAVGRHIAQACSSSRAAQRLYPIT